MRKSWYRFVVLLAGCALMWGGCRACASGEEDKDKAPKAKKVAKKAVPKAETKEEPEKQPKKKLSLMERHSRPSGDTTIKPGATLRLTKIKPQRAVGKPVVKKVIDARESLRRELESSRKNK